MRAIVTLSNKMWFADTLIFINSCLLYSADLNTQQLKNRIFIQDTCGLQQKTFS